jgi:hypothetical protein
MTYSTFNGTLMGEDLTYIFSYANSVTYNLFGLMMVVAFFLIILISSFMMQLRFTARIRPDTSLLAASFATLGFATIISQTTGIIEPIYFFILLGLTLVSFIWVVFGSN